MPPGGPAKLKAAAEEAATANAVYDVIKEYQKARNTFVNSVKVCRWFEQAALHRAAGGALHIVTVQRSAVCYVVERACDAVKTRAVAELEHGRHAAATQGPLRSTWPRVAEQCALLVKCLRWHSICSHFPVLRALCGCCARPA